MDVDRRLQAAGMVAVVEPPTCGVATIPTTDGATPDAIGTSLPSASRVRPRSSYATRARRKRFGLLQSQEHAQALAHIDHDGSPD